MSKLFACDFCGKIIKRDEIYSMGITKKYYEPLSKVTTTACSSDSCIGVKGININERYDLCRHCIQKVKRLKNIEKVERESDFIIHNFDIFP